jgi:nucleoside-diphosphate-sugar epimerase
VYGRHKADAEKLCEAAGALIVRLGPMYGPGMTKGVLVDMLEGKKVYIDGSSRYAFAPTNFVASWIASNLGRSGLVEVGARDSLTLKEVAGHLGATVEFEGAVDHQEIQNPAAGFPSARDVLAFLDDRRKSDA